MFGIGGVNVENLENSYQYTLYFDCIALTVIVLMQEGKSAGLGAIAGAADTYWGKNKGRSMEGALEKSTKSFLQSHLSWNFHSSESEFLRNLQNCHRQVLCERMTR